MKKKGLSNILILSVLLALFFFIRYGNVETSGKGMDTGDLAPRVTLISNFTHSPVSSVVDAGGGAVTVGIHFDVLENDLDLKEAYFTVYDEGGKVKNNVLIDIKDYNVAPTGRVSKAIPVDTSTTGVYTFVLSVSDIQGNISNILSSTFPIRK